MTITDLGAHTLRVVVPDRNGVPADVALTYAEERREKREERSEEEARERREEGKGREREGGKPDTVTMNDMRR